MKIYKILIDFLKILISQNKLKIFFTILIIFYYFSKLKNSKYQSKWKVNKSDYKNLIFFMPLLICKQ